MRQFILNHPGIVSGVVVVVAPHHHRHGCCAVGVYYFQRWCTRRNKTYFLWFYTCSIYTNMFVCAAMKEYNVCTIHLWWPLNILKFMFTITRPFFLVSASTPPPPNFSHLDSPFRTHSLKTLSLLSCNTYVCGVFFLHSLRTDMDDGRRASFTYAIVFGHGSYSMWYA